MKPPKRSRILATSAAALLASVALCPTSAKAQGYNYTWTGAVDNNWETSGNWTTNAPAGQTTPGTDVDNDAILFFPSTNRTFTFNNNLGNTFIASMTFQPGAGAYSLTGNSINFDGAGVILNNSTATQVINFVNTPGFGGINLNNNDFDANPGGGGVIVSKSYFTAARGDLVFNTDIVFSSPLTLVLSGAHNIYLNEMIYNIVGGTGTLEVDGPGKVFLNGQSLITGDTVVNGGSLLVNGSLASMRTFVNFGGTLGGTGIIGGNVFNGGNVAPGGSPGMLTVKGNYFQAKGGTLTIEVGGHQPGQFDVLAVQKQAYLDGTLRLVQLGNGRRLKVGQTIDVLTAAGGVVGRFAHVSDGLYDGTIVSEKVIYHPNKVSVEAVQGSFASLGGLTPNEQAVAGGLDKVAFHNKQPKLINFLDSEPLSHLPGDFDKIAPEELTSIFTIGVALANVQTTNLQRRTDDIRSGSHGFSAAGFATAGSGPLYSGSAGPSGDDGKESKEMKTVVPPDYRLGVFITGVGEWVNVSGDDNARGYNITTGGFTLGADYKLTPNFAVGISAGYAGTGTDLNNGGRVFVNGGKLGLYSTYFTGGFYVDTAVNGGYNSYDTRRDGLQGTARGSTDGGELNTLFATGYDWKVGGFSIGPTASFQYTYLGIRDFTETGSLAPLSFRSQHQDSLRTAFGLKASYDWKLGGILIKPEVRAAWQHEYGDDSYALDSSFQNGSGGLFSVNGPRIGRDSLLLGAGFAILWNERTSTYVYYDGELGRENYESNAVSGGVRISF